MTRIIVTLGYAKLMAMIKILCVEHLNLVGDNTFRHGGEEEGIFNKVKIMSSIVKEQVLLIQIRL